MDVLTFLAIAALLVFLVVPNRYLSAGHWGAALLLYAFVQTGTATDLRREISFWIAWFGGLGLLVYWMLERLKKLDDDAKQRAESDADNGPPHP